jgi:hypothetical protein
VTDEISGDSGFHNPADKTEYSWTAQSGATMYEVARSSLADFSADCLIPMPTTSETHWNESATPLEGGCFFYLVRPLTPNAGSWGQDAAGLGRADVCP